MAVLECSADDLLAQVFLDCGKIMINQDQENQDRCWNKDRKLVDSGSTQKLEVRKEKQFIPGKPLSVSEQTAASHSHPKSVRARQAVRSQLLPRSHYLLPHGSKKTQWTF